MRWAAESTAIPVGRLKKPFAAFQAADGALILAAWHRRRTPCPPRIGDVDIVLRIDGDALRGQRCVLALFMAGEELVLLLREIEDVHPVGAGIAHDDAPMRIGGDAVGIDQVMEVRLAGDHVHQLGPEAALRFHLALQAEAALPGKLAAAFQQELRTSRLLGGFL